MEGRHTSSKHSAASARRAAGSSAELPGRRPVPADPDRVRMRREAQARMREDAASEEPEKSEKESRRKSGGGSVLRMILLDILMTGLILVVFAFFHHVLPRITAKNTVVQPISTVSMPAPVSAAPELSPEISPETSPEPTDGPVEPSPEPVVEDGRTEWQRKFADKFTDEVVITDHSYSSPNISIDIGTFSGTYNGFQQTYYVADIYVAGMENFQTYFANGQYTYYGEQDGVAMTKNAGAILSMNGDWCNNQKFGILVRNGVVYHDDPMAFDLCVLYHDGTVETYSPGSYDPADILAAGAYQTWKFGPMLLDSEGRAMTSFNTTAVIENEAAPRSGFGYYEPGHYCFVVADGRQSHARGMVLSEFAQLFEDLGCVRAYNMDGGASSVMTFEGKQYNRPSAYRKLGEILLITETAGAEG